MPALYVTEAEAHTPALPAGSRLQPKWVEVEETIEVRVQKTGPRSVSPAREVPCGTPGVDPNTNNSNNKLLAQEPMAWDEPIFSIHEPLVFCVDARPEETPKPFPCPAAEEEEPLEEVKGGAGMMEGPLGTDGLWGHDPKILTHNGRVLTLADLEDYVPQEGETFGCGNPLPSPSADPPCEVAVLQREISEPTVGQPVLLAVGHPPGPRGPPRPSSCWEASPVGAQVLGPSGVSFSVREDWAGGTTSWKPSFCTHVQRSVNSGQSSFKTEVSTQTVSFGTVGETVTLHIRRDEDEAPGPSQG